MLRKRCLPALGKQSADDLAARFLRYEIEKDSLWVFKQSANDLARQAESLSLRSSLFFFIRKGLSSAVASFQLNVGERNNYKGEFSSLPLLKVRVSQSTVYSELQGHF